MFTEAIFLYNWFLAELNDVQYYFGQILATREKLLILHIIAFMLDLSF